MSQEDSQKTLTTVVYGLHAASFIFGITSIIAVIVNYVKRDEVAGTWLESHFKWQIRTFWWGLLWLVIGTLTTPFIVGVPIIFVSVIWYIYRIVKGWLRLNDDKQMYVKP